jgi:hypothetical protein
MNKTLFLIKNLGKITPGFFGKKLKRPVFIIGSGRSGTTMLNDLLNTHQSIVSYPTEANELWHPALYPYHENNVKISPIWIDPAAFTNKSVSLWPKKWIIKIRSIFSIYQLLSGKPVFLNKTVMINFMLDEVLRGFPDAKFIYMVRNGWSVALSYQKKESEKYRHPRYMPFQDIVNSEEKIRLAHAKYWNETIKIIDKNKLLFKKDNFYELKYEKLVVSPYEEIKKLLEFIDLPMGNTKEFISQLKEIENRNYKAKQHLNEMEKNELRNVMKEGLLLSGYTDL